ncbi:MAG: carboxypeptidase-like regulatory domain-containing protein [Terriglobales bacterium]
MLLVWAVAGTQLPVAAQQPRPAPTAAQVLFLAAASAPSVAKGRGQLLGYVVDAEGHPAPGALVEVRAAGLRKLPVRVLTSVQGLFRVLNVAPGVYYVEVGKGQRVAARRRVRVAPSERALLLFNLPRLLQAARFGPPPGVSPDEAFAWALRSEAMWRPVLRYNDSNADVSTPMEGYVALTAGAGDSAFASSAMATKFRLDSIALGDERLALSGMVGTDTGLGAPDTQVKAVLQPADPSSGQRLAFSVRQLSIPARSELPSLRLFSFNYTNTMPLGSALRVQYGSMVNTVTMTDTVVTVDPYVRVMAKIGPEGVLEYRAVSGVPPLRFAANSVNMDDTTPQVTLDQGRARLERARHQELRYTESLTPSDTLSAAVFQDAYTRTAINGAFALAGAAPDASVLDANPALLPDLASNMFLADGGNYGGWGYRVGLEHQLGDGWRVMLGYSTGPVLAPVGSQLAAAHLASGLGTVSAHSAIVKITGTTPLTHTQLVCSYRSLSRLAATGLDLYDDSFTQGRSYANVFVRQPLPGFLNGGGRLAALVEIHNLLAQGYIPVVASDGQTLFLVQSARSLRGGLTISF